MGDQAAGATGVNALMNGWYSELSEMWPGQAMSLKVEEVLYSGKSDFQDVLVFNSSNYGRVLVLDGAIQVTQRDEFSYQEMMAHVPLCAVAEPAKRVLVVGGGDGGVVREVARHADVQSVECVDIDKMVPEMSRKFFPELAVGFEDPRAKLIIGDGLKFVEARAYPFETAHGLLPSRLRLASAFSATFSATAAPAHRPAPLEFPPRFAPLTCLGSPLCHLLTGPQEAPAETYDAIIVDSSDPIGPASVLFSKAFYQNMHRALKPGGVVCAQGESAWLHLNLIKECVGMCREVFVGGSVTYAFCAIPTYPSGQIGFILCTKAGGKTDIKQPARQPPAGLRYYTPDVHKAAFVLPKFAADELKL